LEPNAEKLNLLIPHTEIIARVKELADDLSKDYTGKPLLMIAVLKGAFPFLADITRALTIPAHVDFISVSSYDGTKPCNDLKYHLEPVGDIEGKHVVIIEDIIDTGRTIASIVEKIQGYGALDVKICTLFKRESTNKEILHADYVGFTIKDGFVVGYGLDHNEDYRTLNDIYTLNCPD